MIPAIDPYTQSILKDSKKVAPWEPENLVEKEICMMNDFFSDIGVNKIVEDKKRLELQYDNLLPMQSRYVGEDIYYGGYLDRITDYQIFCYEGKLYDSDGNPINSEPLNHDTGAFLVMNQQGALFFLPNKIRGKIQHSTFLAAGPTSYACILEVKDGEIVKEEPYSGHYEPTRLEQWQFHDRLESDFTVTFDKRLSVVFLANWEPRFDNSCGLTNDPLFDPVKLPCNHIFNKRAITRWHETRKCCPYDLNPFEISEIVPDVRALSLTQHYFPETLEDIRSKNSSLDAKVLELGLDDREDHLTNISTIATRMGVHLFLDRNTTFERIGDIANILGIWNPSEKSPQYRKITRYIIGGKSYNGDRSISKIKSYNGGILTIHLIGL